MRHHAPPGGGGYHQQEPLYDPDVPTPSHAERARTLLAQARTGVLSTSSRERDGHPYGSLVTFGIADGGAPVLLISRLAEHTRNLEADPRCSLLAAESSGAGDPLALGRVTVVGTCEPVDEGEREAAREVFLARNPDAAYYVDFRDFGLWRLRPEAIRYIGGYGRMSWVEDGPWTSATADPIAAHAPHILEHMNQDHANALVLYCRAFSRADDTTEARMVSVDRYGFEMSARTAAGPRPIRVAFDAPAASPDAVRAQMVALVHQARERLGARD